MKIKRDFWLAPGIPKLDVWGPSEGLYPSAKCNRKQSWALEIRNRTTKNLSNYNDLKKGWLIIVSISSDWSHDGLSGL